LAYPKRLPADFERFCFRKYPSLTFLEPDTSLFRNLGLAYQALESGGNMPCILNAANEVVVKRFLDGSIGFTDMPGIIEYTMEKAEFIGQPGLEDYLVSDTNARKIAQSQVFK
jgi:1-deoxy-D-xylulose-5-phosphate reductoisomerase